MYVLIDITCATDATHSTRRRCLRMGEDLCRLASESPLRAFSLAVQRWFEHEAEHAARANLNVRQRALCSPLLSAPVLKACLFLDYYQRCSNERDSRLAETSITANTREREEHDG